MKLRARQASRGLLVSALIVGSAISGCARWPEGDLPPVPTPIAEAVDRQSALRPVDPAELPLLIDDLATSEGWQGLRTALERHRSWISKRPKDRRYLFGDRYATAEQLTGVADQLLTWLEDDPSPERFAVRIAHAFDVLESVGDRDGDVLVTGYYEPLIEGSRRRSAEYPVPVYGPPSGLVRVDLGAFDDGLKGKRIAGLLKGNRLVPFPDRQGIRESNVMGGREIAWAKDPVDLFFVEVQGSGALRLPDGSEMRIGYAGANGRIYRSIGRLLIDEGKVPREKMSMQAIRQYLAEHPEEIERVLDHNPSVVFFRKLNGPPVGNLGVPVTPGRSIAVDQRFFPRGGFGFLITDLPAPGPDGETVVEGQITRFVLAQDTGGAIRGPGRVDLFWGRGEDAAARAGVMKQPGRLFFFLPKDAPTIDEDSP